MQTEGHGGAGAFEELRHSWARLDSLLFLNQCLRLLLVHRQSAEDDGNVLFRGELNLLLDLFFEGERT